MEESECERKRKREREGDKKRGDMKSNELNEQTRERFEKTIFFRPSKEKLNHKKIVR